MEILQIEDLSFRYPEADRNALSSVSFSVKRGEFIVVCGESGCGKTTLLRLLKPEISPAGDLSGSVKYLGEDTLEIGFVMQDPDSQIVTDTVWHELAFGLENLGLPCDVIRRRVGETACYFGIEELFRRKTDGLSGGQKQLLNLAAVTAMQPKVLILDEPTGQLDPIAASEFIATLSKLNRELGMTVILAEHRLEEVFPIADRVLVMDDGRAALFDLPEKIGGELMKLGKDHPMLEALPSAVRICGSLGYEEKIPMTVREGRDFIEDHFGGKKVVLPEKEYIPGESIAVELKNVFFRYERDLPDVLRGTSAKIYEGEIFAILGGNGVGKTTMLNVIGGLLKPYRGKVLVAERPVGAYKGNSLYTHNLAILPQNPRALFVRDTVGADLSEIPESRGIKKSEREALVVSVAKRLKILHLLGKNPFDLSGGEQQKCALAKVLLAEPRIVLLDEPTKAIDASAKRGLSEILSELKSAGVTVIIVTHDTEFAAENADRCALFFDGELISEDIPQRFFGGNTFYTTAANRIVREVCPNAVTVSQAVGSLANGDTK